MKVIGLISGGKDSCYNLVQCVAAGHQIVALANLKPVNPDEEEIDSQMYQSVGTSAVEYIARAMELPFYVDTISGAGKSTGRDYTPTQGDEVEDLYRLLARVSTETGAEAVSVGAILSDYQRVRVESVCLRLSLVPLAFLWRRDQVELLREMIECGMKSVLIKVACLGLNSSHLGLTLEEMEDELLRLKNKFGINVCGEGGEYETFTLDSPLFRKKLEIEKKTCIVHSNDAFAPVSYLHLDVQLAHKDIPQNLSQSELLEFHLGRDVSPDHYLGDLVRTGVEDGASYPGPRSCQVHSNEPNVKMKSPGEGWIELLNIPGRGDSPSGCTSSALSLLKTELGRLDRDLSSVVRVVLYISDMDDFAEINRTYTTFFSLNPPVRVCVALGQENLPQGVGLSLSVRSWVGPSETQCLHVQGISHWAPSNIGPYSQAQRAGGYIHVSGQIALVPGSMKLISQKEQELDLSFRHAWRVLEAMEPDITESSVCSALCYVLDAESALQAQAYWRQSRRVNSTLEVLLVKQLPRAANFELQLVAKSSRELC